MQQDRFSLTGKTAIVTGAARGIGQAIAIGLAEAGAAVIATGRDVGKLEATRAAIEKIGGRCILEMLDVSQKSSIDQAFAAIAATTPQIDILVNNAGVEQPCPSMDVDEVLWDRVLDTNLKGAFFCAQAAARLMLRAGSGSIINICSLLSDVGVGGSAAYGSSKTGLLGMTRALATEWAASGIRVNGIGPGYFRTEMTEGFFQTDGWEAMMIEKVPMRRFGKVEDLVGAAIFLGSPASSYVTGQLLYVDGGFMAAM
jgi:gluconate 5-dehydrogenase